MVIGACCTSPPLMCPRQKCTPIGRTCHFHMFCLASSVMFHAHLRRPLDAVFASFFFLCHSGHRDDRVRAGYGVQHSFVPSTLGAVARAHRAGGRFLGEGHAGDDQHGESHRNLHRCVIFSLHVCFRKCCRSMFMFCGCVSYCRW